MEFDRRVQVRLHSDDGGRPYFGSGYLIAPRLVLTAAHLLGDDYGPDAGRVTVRTPALAGLGGEESRGGGEFPATVCWYRKDRIVDAALVEIDDGSGWPVPESLHDTAARPPQRWGRLIGPRSHPVSIAGFPRMQHDPDSQERAGRTLDGYINPGNQSPDQRYEISSTDPTRNPFTSTDKGTRWSGMSGAAVLADAPGGDLLCGVTRHDLEAEGGTILTATPAALLLDDRDFCAQLATHSGWEPVLEPVEPAHLLAPAAPERDVQSPAALLRADTEAVAFYGREEEFADLRGWCENSPANLLVRVLIGPGGQGKTRLARQLTQTLARAGWVTGHLRPDLTDYDTSPDMGVLTTALPMLLVVDYAETRPRLVRHLITHLHIARHRVRLLLLARSDGEWRTDALNAAPRTRTLLSQAPVIDLPPLIPHTSPSDNRSNQEHTHTAREAGFRRAVRDLAHLLPQVPTLPPHDWDTLANTVRAPDDLTHPRFDNALTLQLIALTSLLQHGPTSVTTGPTTPGEEILLNHEERFWEDSATAPAFKLALPTAVLATAVAAAALCGAADREEALGTLSTIPGLSTDHAFRTAVWIARLYPPGPGRYWGSLQPDRIAEYHASRSVLADHGLSLPDLLAVAAPGQQAQLITVLARAAIAHYNTYRHTDSTRVLQALTTALRTTSPHPLALFTAAAALPHSHITNPLAINLTTLLVNVERQLATEVQGNWERRLAGSLTSLGNHLFQAGRKAEGLAAAEEAVEIYRRLATEDPATHEPDFARSLTNLSTHFSGAGRKAECLPAVEEAVEIYRRLATEDPATHEPDLARSLTNLGIHLWEAGRKAEGLAATEEAVEIYRRLATEDPATHEPDLARSLTNLSTHFSGAGRKAECLAATAEAVEIYRRLTTQYPAAHEPDMATLLFNYGVHLSDAGRKAEALTAAQQATDVLQRLAADSPAAYEATLARSLSLLSNCLWALGRKAEALTSTEQAFQIHRRLAAKEPATYEPELAASLSQLRSLSEEVGRPAGILTAAQQVMEIRQRLAAQDPAAHEPALATSLVDLALLLQEAGRQAEALTAITQAVQIHKRLATQDPTCRHDLAASLSALGSLLVMTERWDEALKVIDEALAIYLGVIEKTEVVRLKFAAEDGPQILNQLNIKSILLGMLGHQREADETQRLWLVVREALLAPDHPQNTIQEA